VSLTVRMAVSIIADGSMLPTAKELIDKLRAEGLDSKIVTNERARENRHRFVKRFGLDPATVTCMAPGVDKNDELVSVLPGAGYGIGTGYVVPTETIVMPVYTGRPTVVLASAADCGIWALAAERPLHRRIDMTIGHLAVVHYGWRQALQGLLAKAYTALKEREPGAEIKAIVSPSICEECYTIRSDVFHQFRRKLGERVTDFLWKTGQDGHGRTLYALDLSGLALDELTSTGPFEYSSNGVRRCTFEDRELFSQRATNQGKKPWGRMGVLVIAS
jgi:methylmalonyl-CoA mutase cobalamin-binding subunit